MIWPQTCLEKRNCASLCIWGTEAGRQVCMPGGRGLSTGYMARDVDGDFGGSDPGGAGGRVGPR